METKLRVSVARTQSIILFELILPLNSWFRIFFFQILEAVVYQMVIVVLGTNPADQFGLFEVLYVSSIYFSIHSGAPFVVGLQVNQPYFMIITVRYHNLLQADHLNKNTPKIFTFHFLSKQYLSVAVSVEKK